VADARAARLKAVPLFAHCDAKQIDFIVTQVDEMDFAAGKVLCTEGTYGGDFFILESGAADVTRGDKKIATMQPGDFFGEIALVDGGPRTATVTAEEASRLLVVGHREFHALLEQNPGIQLQVLKALAKRVRTLAPETTS
jgi:CRP-like cAMP-binding protein